MINHALHGALPNYLQLFYRHDASTEHELQELCGPLNELDVAIAAEELLKDVMLVKPGFLTGEDGKGRRLLRGCSC